MDCSENESFSKKHTRYFLFMCRVRHLGRRPDMPTSNMRWGLIEMRDSRHNPALYVAINTDFESKPAPQLRPIYIVDFVCGDTTVHPKVCQSSRLWITSVIPSPTRNRKPMRIFSKTSYRLVVALGRSLQWTQPTRRLSVITRSAAATPWTRSGPT